MRHDYCTIANEPFRKQGQQLCNDGNTTVFFDAYNKDQLKQAVRDFGEQCAQLVFLSGSAEQAEMRICALIKEIQ